MTGGFALVAWPVHYDASGVMTFIVNQDGVALREGPRAGDAGGGREDHALRSRPDVAPAVGAERPPYADQGFAAMRYNRRAVAR